MTTQVKAWGNSCAVRIPMGILKEAGIQRDDELDIQVNGTDIILSKTNKINHKTLEERILAYGGKLDLLMDYDWGEPMGREMW